MWWTFVWFTLLHFNQPTNQHIRLSRRVAFDILHYNDYSDDTLIHFTLSHHYSRVCLWGMPGDVWDVSSGSDAVLTRHVVVCIRTELFTV